MTFNLLSKKEYIMKELTFYLSSVIWYTFPIELSLQGPVTRQH